MNLVTTRRSFVLMTVIVLVAGCAVPPRPTADGSPTIGNDPCLLPKGSLDDSCIADGLDPGESVFWEGPFISVRAEGPGAACNVVPCGSESIDFPLRVGHALPGARLRAAVQALLPDDDMRPAPDNSASLVASESTFALELISPDGKRSIRFQDGGFAAEVFRGGHDADGAPLPAIPSGDWTVRFVPYSVLDLQLRFRAALEAPAGTTNGLLLPDLRIIPPFEIGFALPSSTGGVAAPTDLAVPGASCMVEEFVEAGSNGLPLPTLCLRFSMGLSNAGPGAFSLAARTSTDPMGEASETAGLVDIPLVQRVCDETMRQCAEMPKVDALVARFHAFHRHLHYQAAYVFELWRVDPNVTPAGQPSLEIVGRSGKLGIKLLPEAMEGWTRFYQNYRVVPGGSAGCRLIDCEIGLPSGWGDVYDWNRGGNYIDFPLSATGGPAPGEYVIRGTADLDGTIVESDETNNMAFAHVRVSGLGDVELLERGYGSDPWDPLKTIFEAAPLGAD